MIFERAPTIFYGQHDVPRLHDKSEAKALLDSCRAGYGQLFIHIESGAILIFWPTQFNSSWSAHEVVQHYVQYELIGEDSPRCKYYGMRGNPTVNGFVWLGEYAHYQDPYQ